MEEDEAVGCLSRAEQIKKTPSWGWEAECGGDSESRRWLIERITLKCEYAVRPPAFKLRPEAEPLQS